jgi:hypothetical protein
VRLERGVGEALAQGQDLSVDLLVHGGALAGWWECDATIHEICCDATYPDKNLGIF